MSLVNTLTGVYKRRNAPETPPKILIRNSCLKLTDPTPPTSLRPAKLDDIWLGKSAIVELIFAANGSNPARSKAGKVINEPPPARAFWIPAYKPTAASISTVESGKESSSFIWLLTLLSSQCIVMIKEIARV